ncbi:MAG: presenilin family intramembrane aspartyl protease [Candidatus Bathyarchaeia archaeon]
MNKSFKAELIHLAPIIVSLLFGVGCAYLLGASGMKLFEITPFQEESPAGPVSNALYFVVLVGFGASTLFFLLKKGNFRLIVLVTGFALVSAVFLLSTVYLYAFSLTFTPMPMEALVAVSALMTVSVGYVFFGTKSRFGDFIVLLLGGALGTLLGASIQTLSTVLILCFLAVYDAFAVYHGPVGKIARVGLEKLRGLSFSFKDIQMGLGDLTFYSMLVGHMLLYFGVFSCSASIAGILIGCFLAFKMLERKGVFPGLPIPIFVGLALGFLIAFVV